MSGALFLGVKLSGASTVGESWAILTATGTVVYNKY